MSKNHVERYIEDQFAHDDTVSSVTHDASRDRADQARAQGNYQDPEPPLDNPEYPEDGYDHDPDPETPPPEPEPEPDPEPCPPDEPYPEPEEERRPRPRAERSRADQRIREAISERERAIELANRLAQENEHLRRMANQSSEAVNLFREDSIEHRRELAKKKLLEARENGDLQEEVNANFELGLIAADLKEVQKQKIENEYWQKRQKEEQEQAYYMQQQQAQMAPPEPPPEAVEWFRENPWFQQGHPDYDPNLAEEVEIYSSGLDEKYKRAGLQHQIGGKHYLATLDQFVKKARGTIGNQNQRRGIPMQQRTSRTPVSQARGNTGRPAPRRPGEGLSKEQRDLADSMKIPYAKFEQYVKEDRAEHANMGRGQYL